MRNSTFSIPLKTILVICSLLMFSSCAKKLHFATSTVVPAAEGRVKYKKDDNNNYSISVKIKNLTDPKRLTPSQNVYVLWMDTDQGNVQNLGQIVSSSGVFTSGLKATMETVTSFKPRDFFITAESTPTVTYPGPQVVLRTESR